MLDSQEVQSDWDESITQSHIEHEESDEEQ
jgi:hypothetical protein